MQLFVTFTCHEKLLNFKWSYFKSFPKNTAILIKSAGKLFNSFEKKTTTTLQQDECANIASEIASILLMDAYYYGNILHLD